MNIYFETRTTKPFNLGEVVEHAATICLEHEKCDSEVEESLGYMQLYRLHKDGDIPVYICESDECHIYEEIARIAKKFKCTVIMLFDDIDPDIYDTLYKEQCHYQEGILTGMFSTNYEIEDILGNTYLHKTMVKWFVAKIRNMKILFVESEE